VNKDVVEAVRGITYDTTVKTETVLDTNVLIAGLRSRRGASFHLLTLVGRSRRFDIHLSVPLVLEYEAVAKRMSRTLGLTHADIDDVIDYLCSVAGLHDIFYVWRPALKDPGDEMVLELAVAAGCDAIVTHNIGDYVGASRFGVRVVRPAEFLREIGEFP
jgi:putative PIN family toxin of toxin-antitoxin system